MGHGHLPHHAGVGFRKEFARVPQMDPFYRFTCRPHTSHINSTFRKTNKVPAGDDGFAASYERDSEASQR